MDPDPELLICTVDTCDVLCCLAIGVALLCCTMLKQQRQGGGGSHNRYAFKPLNKKILKNCNQRRWRRRT